MIRNILVAVDGSENSNRALDFALDLGEKFDAAVMILNVSEPLPIVAVPEGSTGYSDGGIALINKDLLKIHEEVLNKAVARARTVKANLTISSSLREGDLPMKLSLLLRKVVLTSSLLDTEGWVKWRSYSWAA